MVSFGMDERLSIAAALGNVNNAGLAAFLNLVRRLGGDQKTAIARNQKAHLIEAIFTTVDQVRDKLQAMEARLEELNDENCEAGRKLVEAESKLRDMEKLLRGTTKILATVTGLTATGADSSSAGAKIFKVKKGGSFFIFGLLWFALVCFCFCFALVCFCFCFALVCFVLLCFGLFCFALLRFALVCFGCGLFCFVLLWFVF